MKQVCEDRQTDEDIIAYERQTSEYEELRINAANYPTVSNLFGPGDSEEDSA